MIRVLLLFVIQLCVVATALSQSSLSGSTIESHPYDEALKSTLKSYHVFEMTVVKSAVDFNNSQSLNLNTGKHNFDLIAYPDNLSVSFKNNDLPHLLSGHSSVGENMNLTIDDDFLYGFIRMGDSRLFIEPVWYFDKSAPRNLFVSYFDYDVIETDEHKCGVETTDIKTEELNVQRVITDECVIIEYALANAHDMVLEFGTVADVEDFNLAVLNTVQANYRSEFDKNVEFDVVDIFIPATAGADPFPSSSNSVTLLNFLASWGDGGGNSGGSSGGFGVNYQMAGLWVDRDIFSSAGTGTVGIAYTPGWHHVFENFSANALELQVMTSHEIGHNFDALHDASGSGFIMAPSVNSTTVWSSASVTDIEARVASQGYLDDCSDLGPPVANFFQSSIITCVGGPVEFEDQSQYGATRVWEFENGTPSTSIVEKETVTFNTLGQHYVKVTSTNDAGSDDYIYYVDVQDAPTIPCSPSGTGGAGGIINVTLENVVNPSDDASTAGRYEDFACTQIMNLEPSTSYNILISTTGSSSTALRMYLDYNGDGDFTDAGESEGNYGLGGGNNYLIPLTTNANPVEDQIVRLRIINDTGTINNSCENPVYSQVEDYGVVFSSGIVEVLGCTDPTASNYDPLATVDDGTCSFDLIWYRDFDSDGFGDLNTSIVDNNQPSGYVANSDDCNDDDNTVFPNAPEVCDGQLNNCNGSSIPLTEIDNDSDGYVECNYNASTWVGDSAVIGGLDCNDNDDTVFPSAPELCDGKRNNCNLSGIPSDEIDNDNDGYVECSYSAATWDGDPTVVGGGDCNDSDDTVYPTAPELCDGQINNCNLSTLPSNEADNDNDGYVECTYSVSTWVGSSSVVGGDDCDDGDDTVYPSAPELCDGQINDCNQSTLPSNEVDNDGDGYVACAYSASTWVGSPTVIGGNDCDDANAMKFPGNTEICDNIDNDCDGFIDENCQPCDGTNLVINNITQDIYRAEFDITATAVINQAAPVVFFAGGDVEMENGFEVFANSEFQIEIEDCIATAANGSPVINSSGSVYFSGELNAKVKLLELVEKLNENISVPGQQKIIITDLSQNVVFDEGLEDLEAKSNVEISELFATNSIYFVQLIDGDAKLLGKFIRIE